MTAPVFIVGTGRCGSTMLSNMVREHPDILSVSEFFTSLTSRAFRGRNPPGETIFRRLNTLSPGGRALLTNGLVVDEFLYPLGPEARYGAGEVPAILCTTLPHLTADHERLWDDLSAALRARGRASLAMHYRFIFEWLAERFGKQVWIERSGLAAVRSDVHEAVSRCAFRPHLSRRPRHRDVHVAAPLFPSARAVGGVAACLRDRPRPAVQPAWREPVGPVFRVVAVPGFHGRAVPAHTDRAARVRAVLEPRDRARLRGAGRGPRRGACCRCVTKRCCRSPPASCSGSSVLSGRNTRTAGGWRPPAPWRGRKRRAGRASTRTTGRSLPPHARPARSLWAMIEDDRP